MQRHCDKHKTSERSASSAKCNEERLPLLYDELLRHKLLSLIHMKSAYMARLADFTPLCLVCHIGA